MKELPLKENKVGKKITHEVSEEVLSVLLKAFSNFQKAVEDARK